MASVEINQQLKRVEIEDFEIQNEIVFKYFDTLPYTERSEKFLKALYIGVLALWKIVYPPSFQKHLMNWAQN